MDKGTIEWQYDLGTPSPAGAAPNPFAKSAAEISTATEAGGDDSGTFRSSASGSSFCRGPQARGARRRQRLDGLVVSALRPARSTRISGSGPRQIVLQVRKPKAILVLETDTGRRPRRVPPAGGGRVARGPRSPSTTSTWLSCSTDVRWRCSTSRRGTNAWVFRESDKLPTHGHPG